MGKLLIGLFPALIPPTVYDRIRGMISSRINKRQKVIQYLHHEYAWNDQAWWLSSRRHQFYKTMDNLEPENDTRTWFKSWRDKEICILMIVSTAVAKIYTMLQYFCVFSQRISENQQSSNAAYWSIQRKHDRWNLPIVRKPSVKMDTPYPKVKWWISARRKYLQ